VSDIVLATTDRKIDDPLAAFADDANISCYRGCTENVARRVLSCCEHYDFDAFLRINGDSPLLHYELIERAIVHMAESNVDIVTNVFPRSYPAGMSVELVTRKAYRRAYSLMTRQSDMEHVTTFIYNNPTLFSILSLHSKNERWANIHLAIDTIEDLDKFKWIISKLTRDHTLASIEDIVDLHHTYSRIQMAKQKDEY
jgi:spore coat polysaccharide biosynthesis protein SpsF